MRCRSHLWASDLNRKALQKTPALAMVEAQTCHRSRRCTKVASEPLIRGPGAYPLAAIRGPNCI